MRRKSFAAWLATAILVSVCAADPGGASDGAARLTVTGRATLEAAPDLASISIGASARAATAAGAVDQVSAAAAKVVAAARAFGIEGRDLQTSQLSLQPAFRVVREPGGQAEQRPDGYQASNQVTVRVRDLPRLGEFLRIVVDGGSNRIGGVEFGLADHARLEREALAAALRDARAKAAAIAEASGLKLGRVVEIRHGQDRGMVPRNGRMRGVMAQEAAPVPVEPGALTLSSEVDVVFGLDPA